MKQKKGRATHLELQERRNYVIHLICIGYRHRKDAYKEFIKRFPDVAKDTFNQKDWADAKKRIIKQSEKDADEEIAILTAKYEFLLRSTFEPINNENVTGESILNFDHPSNIPPSLDQIKAARAIHSDYMKLKGLSAAKKVDVSVEGDVHISRQKWIAEAAD